MFAHRTPRHASAKSERNRRETKRKWKESKVKYSKGEKAIVMSWGGMPNGWALDGIRRDTSVAVTTKLDERRKGVS